MSKFIKVGKTEFNVSAIKRLSLREFKKAYKDKFGDSVEDVYYRITGKKKTKKVEEAE